MVGMRLTFAKRLLEHGWSISADRSSRLWTLRQHFRNVRAELWCVPDEILARNMPTHRRHNNGGLHTMPGAVNSERDPGTPAVVNGSLVADIDLMSSISAV